MALTKVKQKFQVTIPTAVRTAAGVAVGDFVDARYQHGAIVLRPQVVRDREEFLKQVKKDVEASKAAVKAGRYLGPFDNADDAARAFAQFKKQRRAHARRST
jgi:bifunctional DNA-binding transcriptional regulator/antitoxin component of YhaV-PrlF toxin-antitoxin module